MTDIRCVKCNRLLMKIDWGQAHALMDGKPSAEVKCPKCGYLNRFTMNMKAQIIVKPLINIIVDPNLKEDEWRIIQ